MPTLFKRVADVPDLEIMADLHAVIDSHDRFAPIAEFGVKIDVLLGYNDGDADVLKDDADAQIKVLKGEDRVNGVGDVRILINGERYRRYTSRQRAGLLAHELYHIQIPTHREVVFDDADREVFVSRPDLDDYGRPVVKLIKDDYKFTGFREVAQWYGADSGEVRFYRMLGASLEQSSLPFMAVTEDRDSDLIPDTFASLLAVGHTEAGARAAIDAVPDIGRYRSVADLIDAIYQQRPELAPDPETLAMTTAKPAKSTRSGAKA